MFSLVFKTFLLLQTLPTATIGWEPPEPATPVWYNLYRTTNVNSGPCNGGTWTKVNTERISFFQLELQYTDNNALRGLSYYAVTSEDENGQSECSDIVVVNIPNKKPGKPNNPRLVGITP